MNGPIADLSYRNYDGPLNSPTMLWWVIAKQVMRAALKKKSLWVLEFLASFYYVIMIIVIFFTEQASQAATEAMIQTGQTPPITPIQQLMDRIVWKDQFLHGISYGQLFFLIIALMVGVGTIANDNRANALLVYLSKPCDKKDYLLGKWMGIFILMAAAIGIPSVFFMLYGSLSYREYGFLSEDPWMIPNVLLSVPIMAAFHASLSLGISSLFNQGRLAGATYAGIYFMTSLFTVMMGGVWAISAGDSGTREIVRYLFYCSVDGLQIGVTKAILGTSGTMPFGVAVGRGARDMIVPSPPLWFPLGAIICISALAILIAVRRVRAVEVVRG